MIRVKVEIAAHFTPILMLEVDEVSKKKKTAISNKVYWNITDKWKTDPRLH